MAESYNQVIREMVSEIKKLRDTVQELNTRVYCLETRHSESLNLNSKVSDTKSQTSGVLNDVFTMGSEAVEAQRENKLMIDMDKMKGINAKKRTGTLAMVHDPDTNKFFAQYKY